MPPDFERALRDLRAAFPKPAPHILDEVTRKVLRAETGEQRTRRSRLMLTLAAALLLASFVGFSVGHWAMPSRVSAAASISIAARPDIALAWHDTVSVYGAVLTGQAGEAVTVEAKECGNPAPFHDVAKTTTGNGGTWIADEQSYTNVTGLTVGATTQFRAVWRNGTSDVLTVQARPWMNLLHAGRTFQLRVGGDDFFRGDEAVVERLDNRGRWVRVKRIVIERWRSGGPGGSATFTARVRHGTQVRVVLPAAQVKPCFLAGVSNIVKA